MSSLTQRALPQALPEGLQFDFRFRAASTLLFAPGAHACTINLSPMNGNECSNRSKGVVAAMEALAEAVREDEKNLLSVISPFIVPVRAIFLCSTWEITFVMGSHDPNLLIGYWEQHGGATASCSQAGCRTPSSTCNFPKVLDPAVPP